MNSVETNSLYMYDIDIKSFASERCSGIFKVTIFKHYIASDD